MSTTTEIERRLYKEVSASSSETLDYTVPDGKALYINVMGGSAALMPTTRVQISWDATGTEEIITASHACISNQMTTKKFVGDNSKVIRIKLINNSEVNLVMGAYWIGQVEN